MTTTTVHLLRHGEVFNPEKVLYGRLPGYHLSELGHAMAQRIAEHTAGWDIVHIVSSPLERAQETAAPTAAAFGLEPHIDPRVIEAANQFEGRHVAAGGNTNELLKPKQWTKLANPFRPSWGEPYVDIAARMSAALEAAEEAARGHEALVVSHQLPIWTCRLHHEGRRLWHDPRRRECALASLTSFRFTDGVLVGVTYAEPAADLVARAKGFSVGA